MTSQLLSQETKKEEKINPKVSMRKEINMSMKITELENRKHRKKPIKQKFGSLRNSITLKTSATNLGTSKMSLRR